MSCPSSRCGFVFAPSNGENDSCCYRETWGGLTRCIWHADVSDRKPTEELLSARESRTNRDFATRQDQPVELLDGAIIPNATFSEGTDFDSVSFRNANFSNVTLRNGSCRHAAFAGADLSGADFRGSDLTGIDSRASKCNETDFRSTELKNADFFDSTMKEAYLAEATAISADLRHIDSPDVVAKGVTLDHSQLTAADMAGWDLQGASATQVEGSEVVLAHTRLDEATFEDATLIDSTLTNVDAEKCNFAEANLTGIDATNADFQKATFDGGNLLGGTLTKANCALASLNNVYLVGATLNEAHLVNVELTNADLNDATLQNVGAGHANCNDTSFERADLSGSNFRAATLKNARLEDADLTDVSLQEADMQGANIERAILSRADLFGANLHEARTYGAIFAQTRINDATQLGDRCVYDPKSEATVDDQDEVDTLTRAAEAYQELEKLCRSNALSKKQSLYFVRRQDINLAKYRRDGDIFAVARARASRLVLLYGESPFRVIGTAGIIILLAGILYPVFGVVSADSSRLLQYSTDPQASLQALLLSLYFSALTFTTGFSGFQPQGIGRLIATVETLTGAVLLALLVFVFSRRATR